MVPLDNGIKAVTQLSPGVAKDSNFCILIRELEAHELANSQCIERAFWTSPACYLSCGSLSLESIPLPRMETISTMVQTIATVTATGEVGVITVSKISPSRCSSWNSWLNKHRPWLKALFPGPGLKNAHHIPSYDLCQEWSATVAYCQIRIFLLNCYS